MKDIVSTSREILEKFIRELHRLTTYVKILPHGEQAVYKALVYLAQEWRNNVVLVNGKGNFGSAFNPDAYAHQRYTNCGLSEFAYDCFFSEWKYTNPADDMTVDWISTYDDSGLEPMYLPAKYPLFLLQQHRYLCPLNSNI